MNLKQLPLPTGQLGTQVLWNQNLFLWPHKTEHQQQVLDGDGPLEGWRRTLGGMGTDPWRQTKGQELSPTLPLCTGGEREREGGSPIPAKI